MTESQSYTLPSVPVDVSELRDPGERSAGRVMWIFAVPVIIAVGFYSLVTFGILPLFVFLFGRIGQLFVLAHFKMNGVRVSSEQFPVLNHAADNFAQRLGIQRPDVYIVQETVFNAFAARLAGTHVVVLFSGAVDSILRSGDEDDLAFILGHEFGHIAAGHLTFMHYLQALGGWFIWVGLWYRRRMEMTCDRIGLALVGDRDRAMRAMSHMMVGSELASEINYGAAFAQLREHQGEFFVKYRNIYSFYPSLLSRLEHLDSCEGVLPARPAPGASLLPPPLREASAG